jgi:hypothetical protein
VSDATISGFRDGIFIHSFPFDLSVGFRKKCFVKGAVDFANEKRFSLNFEHFFVFSCQTIRESLFNWRWTK